MVGFVPPYAGLGDFKSVGDDVYEFRLTYGKGYRIYFGMEENTIILLLCGGDKSTQRKNIVQAKAFWQDFRKRNDEN